MKYSEESKTINFKTYKININSSIYVLWKPQELTVELESNLQDIVGWGRKWPLDFNAGKTQLILFVWSNSTGAIDVKMDGSLPKRKSSFKMLGFTFFSKLDWISYIISIAKTASKKIGALSCSMKFLSPDVALYALLEIYHRVLHGILLSFQGWYS